MTVFLNGDALTEPGPHGERVRDDSFLLMLSAERDPLEFTVPGVKYGERWMVVADSAVDGPAGPADAAAQPELAAGDGVTLTGNSMLVLRRCEPGDRG
jgi:glycogen operon protein